MVESVAKSLQYDGRFAQGINTYKGKITYRSVAEDLKLEDKFQDLKALVG